MSLWNTFKSIARRFSLGSRSSSSGGAERSGGAGGAAGRSGSARGGGASSAGQSRGGGHATRDTPRHHASHRAQSSSGSSPAPSGNSLSAILGNSNTTSVIPGGKSGRGKGGNKNKNGGGNKEITPESLYSEYGKATNIFGLDDYTGNAQPVRGSQPVPSIGSEDDDPSDYIIAIQTSDPVVFFRGKDNKLTEAEEDQITLMLANETDPMAIDVLMSLKRTGIPYDRSFADYMAQFAHFGWDEQSDYHAMELMTIIAQDRANDWIESSVFVDADTGYVILDRIGVNQDGDEYVGLQQEEIDMMQGRDVIIIHNHNRTMPASYRDLETAHAVGAKSLIIVTPEGFEYVYKRGENGMYEVDVVSPAYDVAPPTLFEYMEQFGLSQRQAEVQGFNPPEYKMYQDDSWQFHSIVPVKYKLQPGETIEDVANRMGVPVDLIYSWNSQISIQSGNLTIGLPGWTAGPQSGSARRLGAQVQRSLYWREDGTPLSNFGIELPLIGYIGVDGTTANQWHLREWWDTLTPTEQHIEMALTATAGIAGFDNVFSFDEVIDWITNRQSLIIQVAHKFDIPPGLLGGVLASEALYDYGEIDSILDKTRPEIFSTAAGISNVHFEEGNPTLQRSYEWALNEYGVNNPWDLAIQEVGEGPVIDPESYDVHDIESYIWDDDWNILAGAMVVNMLYDQYVTNHPNSRIAEGQLSAQDYAVIFEAYRTGIALFGDKNSDNWNSPENISLFQDYLNRNTNSGITYLSGNIGLSYPLMENMKDFFDEK